MRNHRISLQDIATLAGVTKMTVSRYIRSPKKVARETGERIAQIMEEINYIPNRAPAMLLNAQSYTLGVLIPSFQNQLFADILAGIESVTSGHNYQTLIANYNYNRDSEEESVIIYCLTISTALFFQKNIIPSEPSNSCAQLPFRL